jgi:hypothetical protein
VTVNIASWRSLPETKNKNTNDTKKKIPKPKPSKTGGKEKRIYFAAHDGFFWAKAVMYSDGSL